MLRGLLKARFGFMALVAALAFGADCSSTLGQTLTTLATFNGSNGDEPYSDLVADPAGNFYGTTFYGGDYGYGVIYRVDAVTHAVSAVGMFNAPGPANPINFGRLLIDGGGNLYGTTSAGGGNHAGTVFEWSAATHMISTLATFDPATTGTTPYGGLAMDAGGNLFGTTLSGGPKSGGTIFELPKGANSVTVLAALDYSNSPTGGLVADSSGNVFGTTAGGAESWGTAFEIDAATHAVKTLATFDSTTGGTPNGLAVDAKGNLFGTTTGGANNDATIFRIDAATRAIITLATFDGSNGKLPRSDVVLDAEGNLYGTTYLGGKYNLGTVFEFDASMQDLRALVSFDGTTNGAGPVGGVTMDSAGNLYGTTMGGDLRKYGLGTVFEVSVPEPAAMLAVFVAAAPALFMRRRRRVL